MERTSQILNAKKAAEIPQLFLHKVQTNKRHDPAVLSVVYERYRYLHRFEMNPQQNKGRNPLFFH